MAKKPDSQRKLQAEEEKQRDAILKRMLNTPPKPKKGKTAGARQDKPAPRQPKG